jgi:opacity protein-like surface antigen
MKNFLIGFLLVLFAFAFSDMSKADDGEWQSTVIPYFLGAGMNGDVAILGRSVAIDQSFGEILDHLEFGFMGHFESENNKWVVLGDFFYAGLGAQPPQVTVDINQYIVEGGVGRKFGQNFALLGGARFNRLDAKLGFRGPIGIEVEGDQNFLDPYVGARIIAPLSDRFAIYVRGDIGGFGVGSDFAWYFNPAVRINLSQNIGLFIFYRWDHVDYENDDDGFKFDVTISGPGAGVGFRF